VNLASTDAQWAILELEFHVKSTCDEQIAGTPLASSAVLASPTGQHGLSWAFDRATSHFLEMTWWPACANIGCSVTEAWLGLKFSENPVIKCIRIYQYPEASRSVADIRLDRWDGEGWAASQVFLGIGAGFWVDLPVDASTKWILSSTGELSLGWRIRELELFRDIECRQSLIGIPLASNLSAGFDSLTLPSLAFDRNVSTVWRSPCQPCASREPWVGLNLVKPGIVRCVRLLQEGLQYGSSGVVLRYWNGSLFKDATSFVDLTVGIWEYLRRWEVADRPPGSMWRFLPNESIMGTWTLTELELYRNANCSERFSVGTPIGPGNLFAEPGQHPDGQNRSFDGNISTAWLSPFSGGVAGMQWMGWHDGNWTQTHFHNYAWVGISIEAAGPNIRCLRLLQSNQLLNATSTLVVQVWNGSTWTNFIDTLEGYGDVSLWYSGLVDEFTPLRSPTWRWMPPMDRMQWRLVNMEVMWEHWAVKELRFWESLDCQFQTSGIPISDYEDPYISAYPSAQASDNQLATEWWSHCNECAPRQAWIGVMLPAPRNVRCISLFQSSQSPRGRPVPWWTTEVLLEKWNGHRWVSVADARGFGRGAWDNLFVYSHLQTYDDAVSSLGYWATVENTLWRISNLDFVGRRWQIPSVFLYTDVDCKTMISDSVPITSGHVIDFEVPLAFDDILSTEWMSSCEECAERQAWLGLRMPQPRLVRCVGLFQNDGLRLSSARVSLDRWDGQSWSQVRLAVGQRPGAWELIHIDGYNDLAYAQQWRLANAMFVQQMWTIGSMALYRESTCVSEALGTKIASGWREGHPPEAAFDNDTTTNWESSCYGCGQDRAWIGLSFDDAVPIRCAKLWQMRDTLRGAAAVSLQTWGGSTWVQVQAYENINHGVWDYLHIFKLPQTSSWISQGLRLSVEAGTMWRIANNVSVTRRWVIKKLGFMAPNGTKACGVRLSGSAISSGEADGHISQNAFNDSLSSQAWHSSCIGCQPGWAWLGLAFATGPSDVGCVQFEQSGDMVDSVSSLTLERWDGNSWSVHSVFRDLSSGSFLQLSLAWANPPPLTQFRVLSMASVPGRWTVRELQFFVNIECTVAITGVPISSGSYGLSAASLAQDGDLATSWQSATMPGPAEKLWVGTHFETAQDVKCAVVRQGDGLGEASSAVAFERRGVGGWTRVLELGPFSPGGFFALVSFSSAQPHSWINFQDAMTLPPAGYLADAGYPYAKRMVYSESTGLAMGPERTYGWSCEIKGYNRAYFADPLLDTGVILDCPTAIWEIDLLAGRYYVRITYSDPGFGGQTSSCILEGIPVNAGVMQPYDNQVREAIVDVPDSRLTFQGSSRQQCSSISSMEINPLPAALTMWRLANDVRVLARWRVHEFELHASSDCSLNIFDMRTKLVFSSGHADGQEAKYAVDGNNMTAWESPCVSCAPRAAWIGVAFSSLQVVRCVRLYQSIAVVQLASSFVMEQWNGTQWILFERYIGVPGGVWGSYNERWVRPMMNTRWRFAATNKTHEPLRIAGAKFFSDIGCQAQLSGFAIASDVLPDSPAAHAFDNDLATVWRSPCSACNASEAWVGLHFDVPPLVLCAQVALASTGVRRLTLETAEERRLTAAAEGTSLQLQLWNGNYWASAAPAEVAHPGIWTSVNRLVAVDVRPGTFWRIVNLANTSAPWTVSELEFHLEADCQGAVQGRPMASTFQPDALPHQAFDGSTSYKFAWTAGCDATGCLAGSEWIGALFETSHRFQCVRIYQASPSLAGDPSSAIVRLERWAGGNWEAIKTWGTLDMPVVAGRMVDLIVLETQEKFETGARQWRIVSRFSVHHNWAVAEVKFFDNVECLVELVGTSFASGTDGSRFVSLAVDRQWDTFWYSQPNPASAEAWIGFQYGGEHVVRCVQLLQDRRDGFKTNATRLQSKLGADWLHIDSFTDIAGGYVQNSHVWSAATQKPAASMWRALNFNPIDDGWIVVELEFYSDAACSRIEIGDAISSGYSSPTEDTVHAFDVKLDTWWRSPCRKCSRTVAWLGQSFKKLQAGVSNQYKPARSAEIGCIVVMQGEGPKNATSVINVERWNGQQFVRVARFKDVPFGEFVRLNVNDTSVPPIVDYARKAAMLTNTPPPSDAIILRASLAVSADLVRVEFKTKVAAWPLELSLSRLASESFSAAFIAAMSRAVGARTNVPPAHIFIDDISLNVPNLITSTLDYSMTGVANIFIEDISRSVAVDDEVRGMHLEPRGVQLLFLEDRLKTELRSGTRLDPLQASVVNQVEPTLVLTFATPVLTIANPTTIPPAPPPPTTPPPPPEDKLWIYITLIGGLVGAAAVVKVIHSIYWMRVKARDEKELWRITHPGQIPPKRKNCVQRFVRLMKSIRIRRSGSSSKAKPVPKPTAVVNKKSAKSSTMASETPASRWGKLAI